MVRYRTSKKYPGYRVGDDGSVWSCIVTRGRGLGKGSGVVPTIGRVWRRLKQTKRRKNSPYLFVGLRQNRKQLSVYVHHLVLRAFVGPCPKGMEACHNDGNPTNNAATNLRWDTRKNNHADKKKHGTWQGGENHGMAKINQKIADEIRQEYASDRRATYEKIARARGLSRTTVFRIINRKSWV